LSQNSCTNIIALYGCTNIIALDEFKVKQCEESLSSILNMAFTIESIHTININTQNCCKSKKITNQTYS